MEVVVTTVIIVREIRRRAAPPVRVPPARRGRDAQLRNRLRRAAAAGKQVVRGRAGRRRWWGVSRPCDVEWGADGGGGGEVCLTRSEVRSETTGGGRRPTGLGRDGDGRFDDAPSVATIL